MTNVVSMTICNLLLIGAFRLWGCSGNEELRGNKISRRRLRYVPTSPVVSNIPVSAEDKELEDFGFRGISFSMPPEPNTTTSPAKPPTREDRDLVIQAKCGVTAIERSRDILAELLTVSDAMDLTNPETSQYKARDWLDNIDAAVVCSANIDRIEQRYRLALLYFELGGSQWKRCRAEEDASSTEEECPGKRFLSKGNECEWGMMYCTNYDSATAEWLDAYYPLEVMNLQSNNLKGELFKEFYEFTNLKEVFLNDNSLAGQIDNKIGELKNVAVLQLEFNMFEGPLPEKGLFEMEWLAGLSIQGNMLTGSLQSLCEAREDRRKDYESYLASMIESDCLGEPPEVSCSCCTCF